MKMLRLGNFLENFGRAAPPIMDMSIYRDNFKCACGKTHWFDEFIQIICEGFQKVMVFCPEDQKYITNLKIKTFLIFKFKGFESLAGTHIETTEDEITLKAIKLTMRG
jgi:hypothetical protein